MTDTAAAPPLPTSIPNVRPGAVSGLDNAPLVDPNASPLTHDTEALDYPAVPEDLSTVDDLLGWVHDAEDEDETVVRAVVVLSQEGRDGRVTLVGPLEDLILGALLAGYADATAEEDEADEPQGIEGDLVESDTAGTGAAVNADTGEVTQPGDPLPAGD